MVGKAAHEAGCWWPKRHFGSSNPVYRIHRVTSEPTKSSVRPEGWVGDPAQLEKARRYRAITRWGAIPFYVLLAVFWVFVFTGSSLQWVLLLVLGIWAAAAFVLQRRVGRIIGRKWSFRLEAKERQAERKAQQAKVTERPRSQKEWPHDHPQQKSSTVADWLSEEDESDAR